jgi:hypothetical protein
MDSIKTALRGAIQCAKRFLRYVSARASEHSTWAGITTAVLGGAVAEKPYSYMAIAAGVIGVFAKTKKEGSPDAQ